MDCRVEGRGFLKGGHVRATVLSPKIESDLGTGRILNSCIDDKRNVVPELNPSDSHFKIRVVLEGQNRSALVAAMVDCGATALFISERFVKTNKVHTRPLPWKVRLCNINGSENRVGSISRITCLRLQVGDERDWEEFLVMDLGLEDVVLGLPWLRKVNPKIDWAEGTLKLMQRPRSGSTPILMMEAQCWCWHKLNVLKDPSEQLWCTVGYTYSTELAEKASQGKLKKSFEDIVPEQYR